MSNGMARLVQMAVLAAALTFAPSAFAHHILGIPHYAYDEDYPQTPVLTYRVDAGRYEVRMTGYPGVIEPGQRCSLHVYVKDATSGELFDGVVTATVKRDRLLADDSVIYGPISSRLEERVYKFYPQFEHEGDYAIHVAFESDGEPWTIELPIVVGNPGSPWTVVGFLGAGVVVFLIVIRAFRIKLRRRQLAAATGLRSRRPQQRTVSAGIAAGRNRS